MLRNQDLEQPKSKRVVQKVQEETDKSYECAICYEEACDPVTLRCGHLFCWPCVDKYWNYAKGNHLCPCCRAEINIEEDVIPLYGHGGTYDSKYSHPRPQAPLSKKTVTEEPTFSGHSVQQTADSARFWKAATAVSVAGFAVLGCLFAFREANRSRKRRDD